jgi:hypothetical protein
MMNAIKNDWSLEPFKGVGAFKLGEHVSSYLKIPNLLEPWDEEDQDEDSISYNILGTRSYISADENGKIETVSCHEKCNFKGENLIGKSLKEIESILNAKAEYDDNLAEQDVYVIDELELMIWVKDGFVSIIDCGIYIDPNEPA